MEGAAQPALLVAAVVEIGAAVRAVRLDDADPAVAVAEGQQVLAQNPDLLGRAVALGQLLATAAPASRSGAAARPSACPGRCASGTRCPPGSASVAQSVLVADIAAAMAEALGHHRRRGPCPARRPRRRRARHSGRRACAAFGSWPSAERARRAHQQLAELDDADVGRAEMLASCGPGSAPCCPGSRRPARSRPRCR